MTAATLRSVNPAENARPGGHYSHGTIANGFVFVSGQLPVTPAGERLSNASFAEQARQALANVEAVLKACGSDIDRLVQVRVYVDSVDHWPEFNAVYAEWAGESRPSRAVVPTGPLRYGLGRDRGGRGALARGLAPLFRPVLASPETLHFAVGIGGSAAARLG